MKYSREFVCACASNVCQHICVWWLIGFGYQTSDECEGCTKRENTHEFLMARNFSKTIQMPAVVLHSSQKLITYHMQAHGAHSVRLIEINIKNDGMNEIMKLRIYFGRNYSINCQSSRHEFEGYNTETRCCNGWVDEMVRAITFELRTRAQQKGLNEIHAIEKLLCISLIGSRSAHAIESRLLMSHRYAPQSSGKFVVTLKPHDTLQ